MDLHIGYEAVEPWPLTRTDIADEKARKNGVAPKAMLKADKDIGRIALDSETVLTGIPPQAWDYKLGNRSALEWILDQYKEKTPKDPTIRAKFNTYRFADHKEKSHRPAHACHKRQRADPGDRLGDAKSRALNSVTRSVLLSTQQLERPKRRGRTSSFAQPFSLFE